MDVPSSFIDSGTSMISALFEGFYNDGLWGKYFFK